MSKKGLSLVLAFILVLSAFTTLPINVFATKHEFSSSGVISGTTGDCTWELDGTVLTIYGNGKMEDYDPYEYGTVPPWQNYSNIITKANICEGVANIGSYAFYECYNISEVSFSNTVNSIGHHAFLQNGCLTDIPIPNSVSYIGEEAFFNCSRLKNILIPNSVTCIGSRAFDYTPWFNKQPDGSVYAGKVLYSYKGVCPDELELREGTVGIADYALRNSSTLKHIVLPSSLKCIGVGAFLNCQSLLEIQLPNSVLIIGSGAFSGCVKLSNITIPDSVVKICSGAFTHCLFKSITIPRSVTDIGDYAVGYYTNLPDAQLPGFTIFGYKDSVAEKYALENNIAFIPLSNNPIVLGDVDSDGVVSILDATVIQRHLAEIPVISYNEKVADTDGDGSVTILDATSIQRHLAELPTNTNIGKPIS